MMKYYKYLSYLPFVAVIIGAWLLYDKFFGKSEETIAKEKKDVLVNDAIDKINPKKEGTEHAAKINSIAAIQLNAMQYSGTDENALLDSLKNLSRSELLEVYKAFGRQVNYTFGWASEKQDLFAWYEDELSTYGSTYGKLKAIWKVTGLWI